jgi:hypothetical protein
VENHVGENGHYRVEAEILARQFLGFVREIEFPFRNGNCHVVNESVHVINEGECLIPNPRNVIGGQSGFGGCHMLTLYEGVWVVKAIEGLLAGNL